MATSRVRGWRGATALVGALALGLAGWGWDCATREPAWPALASWSAPRGALGFGFSADGRRFSARVVDEGPGREWAWDVATGTRVASEGSVALLKPVRTANGRWAVGWRLTDGRTDMALVRVDLASGVERTLRAEPHDDRTYHNNSSECGWCDAAPIGTWCDLPPLALGDDDRTVRVIGRDGVRDWNAPLLVRTIDLASGAVASRAIVEPTTRGIADLGKPIAASPDGQMLAYLADDRAHGQLWDSTAGRALGPRFDAQRGARFVGREEGWEFTPDGQTLILPAPRGEPHEVEVRVVLGEAGGSVRTLAVASPGFTVALLIVAHDGRTVAAWGVRDRVPPPNWVIGWASDHLPGWPEPPTSEVVVTDLRTGTRLARSAGSGEPHSSPDGRTIVTREPGDRFAVRAVPATEGGASR